MDLAKGSVFMVNLRHFGRLNSASLIKKSCTLFVVAATSFSLLGLATLAAAQDAGQTPSTQPSTTDTPSKTDEEGQRWGDLPISEKDAPNRLKSYLHGKPSHFLNPIKTLSLTSITGESNISTLYGTALKLSFSIEIDQDLKKKLLDQIQEAYRNSGNQQTGAAQTNAFLYPYVRVVEPGQTSAPVYLSSYTDSPNYANYTFAEESQRLLLANIGDTSTHKFPFNIKNQKYPAGTTFVPGVFVVLAAGAKSSSKLLTVEDTPKAIDPFVLSHPTFRNVAFLHEGAQDGARPLAVSTSTGTLSLTAGANSITGDPAGFAVNANSGLSLSGNVSLQSLVPTSSYRVVVRALSQDINASNNGELASTSYNVPPSSTTANILFSLNATNVALGKTPYVSLVADVYTGTEKVLSLGYGLKDRVLIRVGDQAVTGSGKKVVVATNLFDAVEGAIYSATETPLGVNETPKAAESKPAEEAAATEEPTQEEKKEEKKPATPVTPISAKSYAGQPVVLVAPTSAKYFNIFYPRGYESFQTNLQSNIKIKLSDEKVQEVQTEPSESSKAEPKKDESAKGSTSANSSPFVPEEKCEAGTCYGTHLTASDGGLNVNFAPKFVAMQFKDQTKAADGKTQDTKTFVKPGFTPLVFEPFTLSSTTTPAAQPQAQVQAQAQSQPSASASTPSNSDPGQEHLIPFPFHPKPINIPEWLKKKFEEAVKKAMHRPGESIEPLRLDTTKPVGSNGGGSANSGGSSSPSTPEQNKDSNVSLVVRVPANGQDVQVHLGHQHVCKFETPAASQVRVNAKDLTGRDLSKVQVFTLNTQCGGYLGAADVAASASKDSGTERFKDRIFDIVGTFGEREYAVRVYMPKSSAGSSASSSSSSTTTNEKVETSDSDADVNLTKENDGFDLKLKQVNYDLVAVDSPKYPQEVGGRKIFPDLFAAGLIGFTPTTATHALVPVQEEELAQSSSAGTSNTGSTGSAGAASTDSTSSTAAGADSSSSESASDKKADSETGKDEKKPSDEPKKVTVKPPVYRCFGVDKGEFGSGATVQTHPSNPVERSVCRLHGLVDGEYRAVIQNPQKTSLYKLPEGFGLSVKNGQVVLKEDAPQQKEAAKLGVAGVPGISGLAIPGTFSGSFSLQNAVVSSASPVRLERYATKEFDLGLIDGIPLSATATVSGGPASARPIVEVKEDKLIFKGPWTGRNNQAPAPGAPAYPYESDLPYRVNLVTDSTLLQPYMFSESFDLFVDATADANLPVKLTPSPLFEKATEVKVAVSAAAGAAVPFEAVATRVGGFGTSAVKKSENGALQLRPGLFKLELKVGGFTLEKDLLISLSSDPAARKVTLADLGAVEKAQKETQEEREKLTSELQKAKEWETQAEKEMKEATEVEAKAKKAYDEISAKTEASAPPAAAAAAAAAALPVANVANEVFIQEEGQEEGQEEEDEDLKKQTEAEKALAAAKAKKAKAEEALKSAKETIAKAEQALVDFEKRMLDEEANKLKPAKPAKPAKPETKKEGEESGEIVPPTSDDFEQNVDGQSLKFSTSLYPVRVESPNAPQNIYSFTSPVAGASLTLPVPAGGVVLLHKGTYTLQRAGETLGLVGVGSEITAENKNGKGITLSFSKKDGGVGTLTVTGDVPVDRAPKPEPKPGEDKPSTPSTPGTPSAPSTPGTPSTPSTPGAPSVPNQPTVLRGSDRYETNVASIRAAFTSANTVFVASGEDFADALSAGPAAAKEGAPLLLATRGGLAPSASDLLRSLGVKSAVLIGGESSLSSNVEAGLKAAGVETVERVAGSDRVETSVKVKEKYFAGATTALYASGWSFPDALAASSAGALLGAPVILAGNAYSVDAQFTTTFLVGGTNALPEPANAGAATRIAGSDRLDTSVKLLEQVVPRVNGGLRGVAYASGWSFPDALSAVNLAKLGVGLLLASDSKPAGAERVLPNVGGSVYVVGSLGTFADRFAS